MADKTNIILKEKDYEQQPRFSTDVDRTDLNLTHNHQPIRKNTTKTYSNRRRHPRMRTFNVLCYQYNKREHYASSCNESGIWVDFSSL